MGNLKENSNLLKFKLEHNTERNDWTHWQYFLKKNVYNCVK